MKDAEARDQAERLSRDFEKLVGKLQTLDATLLNTTKRLRALEEKVFPTCKECGQRLPNNLYDSRIDTQNKG